MEHKSKVTQRSFKKQLVASKQEMLGKGEIEAILSSIGEIDLDGDVMVAGCFDDFIDSGKKVPMLWAHDRAEIIGTWQDFEIDGDKLKASGQLFEPVQRAREASHLLDAEMVKGVSIGFIAREYEWNWRDDESELAGVPLRAGFDFKNVEILEASLVLWAANQSAEVEELKNPDGSIDVRKLERHLAKTTDLSRKESSTIIQTLSLVDPDSASISTLSESVEFENALADLYADIRNLNRKR